MAWGQAYFSGGGRTEEDEDMEKGRKKELPKEREGAIFIGKDEL